MSRYQAGVSPELTKYLELSKEYKIRPWNECLIDMVNSYSTMEAGEVAAQSIVDRLELQGYYLFFMKLNSSSKLPYHNFYHIVCMINNVFEGACHLDLRREEKRALVVAAIFHDFDHSGGKVTDDVNVNLALKRFNDCQWVAERQQFSELIVGLVDWTRVDWSQGILDPDEVKLTKEAIAITKYPYDRDPVSAVERVIRDADLMQPYEVDPAKLKKQYRGLQEEVELQKGMKFTDQQFADGMKAFLGGVVWHTSWATTKAEKLNWEAKKNLLVGMIAKHELHDS